MKSKNDGNYYAMKRIKKILMLSTERIERAFVEKQVSHVLMIKCDSFTDNGA